MELGLSCLKVKVRNVLNTRKRENLKKIEVFENEEGMMALG
jgi:hypothetical protein